MDFILESGVAEEVDAARCSRRGGMLSVGVSPVKLESFGQSRKIEHLGL
jgi:hypothetical protein